jgi:hypothetical protein
MLSGRRSLLRALLSPVLMACGGGGLVDCGPAAGREVPNIAAPPQDSAVGLAPGGCVKMRCGYVDGAGKLAIPPRFKRTLPFYEGLASVYVDGVGWGAIDRTGAFAVAPRFASIGPFSEGLAAAQPDQRRLYTWVYIDRHGRAVIALPFDVEAAFPFHAGKAWIRVPYLFASRLEQIDRNGRVIAAAPGM